MTIKSGFFNSVNGDRKYDARFFAEYFASFIGNGVFPNPSNNLQVVEGENMTTVVKPGKGWINGYYINNDSDYVLQHDIADGVLKRIDRIVMRLNHLTRQIELAVKKGTPSSNPVAPSLQRDTDAYELALGDVLINNGATQITQANITDLRLNNELCGIVHGTVDQVDTTTIFNQYLAWFQQITGNTEQEIDEWKQQQYEAFLDWFQSIQDILDGDVAANLASRITTLEQEFTSHLADVGSLDDLETEDKSSIVNAINEVFTNANNLKSDWAEVIGSPLLPTDTSAQLKSKTQTIKNTLAANLTAKGQPSVGTETLTSLANKVANLSSSVIKNVQRGRVLVEASATIKNISISSVDINNSIVILNLGQSQDNVFARERLMTATLTSATNLRLERTSTAASSREYYFEYQIIEFESSTVRIQKGTSIINSYEVNITISEVNLSKSVLFFSTRTTSTTDYAAGSYSQTSGIISSPTNLQFKMGAFYPEVTVAWQVVEFL